LFKIFQNEFLCKLIWKNNPNYILKFIKKNYISKIFDPLYLNFIFIINYRIIIIIKYFFNIL